MSWAAKEDDFLSLTSAFVTESHNRQTNTGAWTIKLDEFVTAADDFVTQAEDFVPYSHDWKTRDNALVTEAEAYVRESVQSVR